MLDIFYTNNEFDEIFGLTKRCKREKLNKDQLSFLRKEIESQRYIIRDISFKYWISPSIIKHIMKKPSEIFEILPKRRYIKIYGCQRESIKQNIMLMQNQNLLLKMSKNIFFEEWHVVCSLKIIRDLIKNGLNYTYKKCLTRSNIVDFNKVKTLRILFSTNLS